MLCHGGASKRKCFKKSVLGAAQPIPLGGLWAVVFSVREKVC
jgi:hypothetical protein